MSIDASFVSPLAEAGRAGACTRRWRSSAAFVPRNFRGGHPSRRRAGFPPAASNREFMVKLETSSFQLRLQLPRSLRRVPGQRGGKKATPGSNGSGRGATCNPRKIGVCDQPLQTIAGIEVPHHPSSPPSTPSTGSPPPLTKPSFDRCSKSRLTTTFSRLHFSHVGGVAPSVIP